MAEAFVISEEPQIIDNYRQNASEEHEEKNDDKNNRLEHVMNEEEEQTKANTELSVEVDPAVIERLTQGFLAMCLPELQRSKASIDEILQNQQVLTETLEQENSKFSDCKTMDHLADFMVLAKQYYNKLVNIKKDMNSLKEKSTKLKKRAIKLQQQKQKEELQKAQQQEKELERERMLSAKVAKQSPKKS